jgi:hypothetical protein
MATADDAKRMADGPNRAARRPAGTAQIISKLWPPAGDSPFQAFPLVGHGHLKAQ